MWTNHIGDVYLRLWWVAYVSGSKGLKFLCDDVVVKSKIAMKILGINECFAMIAWPGKVDPVVGN